MIVVIPSSRSVSPARFQPLIDFGARFIVVDDTEGSIAIDHPQFEVYNWSQRRKLLGPHEIAIPKRNGACRDLGFYLAWKEGEPNEIVVALDDDCIPVSDGFGDQVEFALSSRPRKLANGAGRHFNVFDLYDKVDSCRLFPRGFPYSERVSYEPWGFDQSVSCKVRLNVGLWRGALDINAIDKPQLEQTSFPAAKLAHSGVVVPAGALVSVCAGNLQFRRELVPAIYQLPVPVEIMHNWAINRYGDIWAGFILKMLMDIRGDHMGVGAPIVNHSGEGPRGSNILEEHLGHMVNEEFIELIVRSSKELESGCYLDMMAHLREEFSRRASRTSPILRVYLQHLDTCLGAWLGALSP